MKKLVFWLLVLLSLGGETALADPVVSLELSSSACSPGDILFAKVVNRSQRKNSRLYVHFVNSQGKVVAKEVLGLLVPGESEKLFVAPQPLGVYELRLVEEVATQRRTLDTGVLRIVKRGTSQNPVATTPSRPSSLEFPTTTTNASPDDWLLGRWVLETSGDIEVDTWPPHRGMTIEFRREGQWVTGYIVSTNSSIHDHGWRDGQKFYRQGRSNPGPFPSPWTITAQGEVSDFSGNWEKKGLSIIQSAAGQTISLNNFYTYNFRKTQKPESIYFIWNGPAGGRWHQSGWVDERGERHRTSPGRNGEAIVSIKAGAMTLNKASKIKQLESQSKLTLNAPLTFKSGGVQQLFANHDLEVEKVLSVAGKSLWKAGTVTVGSLLVKAPISQSPGHTLVVKAPHRVVVQEDGELHLKGAMKFSPEGQWDNDGLVEIGGRSQTFELGTFNNREVFKLGPGAQAVIARSKQVTSPEGVLSRPLLELSERGGVALASGTWDIAGQLSVRGRRPALPLRFLGKQAELILRGQGRFHNLGKKENDNGLYNVGSLELRDKAYCVLSFYQQYGSGQIFIEKGSTLQVNVEKLNRAAIFEARSGPVRIDGELQVFDISAQQRDDERININPANLFGSGTINGRPVSAFGGKVTK
jgi:hypothetical protein